MAKKQNNTEEKVEMNLLAELAKLTNTYLEGVKIIVQAFTKANSSATS